MSASEVFYRQIGRDRASNAYVLTLIAQGDHFYAFDGVENTAEREADAKRRLADCEAILAS